MCVDTRNSNAGVTRISFLGISLAQKMVLWFANFADRFVDSINLYYATRSVSRVPTFISEKLTYLKWQLQGNGRKCDSCVFDSHTDRVVPASVKINFSLAVFLFLLAVTTLASLLTVLSRRDFRSFPPRSEYLLGEDLSSIFIFPKKYLPVAENNTEFICKLHSSSQLTLLAGEVILTTRSSLNGHLEMHLKIAHSYPCVFQPVTDIRRRVLSRRFNRGKKM